MRLNYQHEEISVP